MSRARQMINCKLSSSFHSFSNILTFRFAFPAQFKPQVFCRTGRMKAEAAYLKSYYPCSLSFKEDLFLLSSSSLYLLENLPDICKQGQLEWQYPLSNH